MKFVLEDSVGAWSANGLDEAGLKTFDGDRAVLGVGEKFLRVFFVDELDSFDSLPWGLFHGLGGEVAVSKDRGFIAGGCQGLFAVERGWVGTHFFILVKVSHRIPSLHSQ